MRQTTKPTAFGAAYGTGYVVPRWLLWTIILVSAAIACRTVRP